MRAAHECATILGLENGSQLIEPLPWFELSLFMDT
jgi:hypothetical protein